MAGFSENLVPLWIDDTDALSRYEYNPEKAAEILEGLGFSKADDGVWVTDKGDRMAYELTAAAAAASI